MSEQQALAALDATLAAHHMRGQWKSEAFLGAAIGGAKPAGAPALWPWSLVLELIGVAEQALPESGQARRSLIFQNPALPRGTTQTINMGVQMITPGEVAWAHRHSIAALRFIVEGDPALTTIVDGQHCVMETGDLVLTPSWTWHDHHNRGDRRAFWLDVLDVPLVLSLNQTLYEPAQGPEQPPLDPGHAVRAVRYPWAEAVRQLAQAPVRRDLGQVHEYRDPATGGPTLPTLMCRLVRLPPGHVGVPIRHTASAVWFVVRGTGRAEINGTPLDWSWRDSFVIPNWCHHTLSNRSQTEDAVLFTVSDRPALTALGLYREMC